MKNIFRNLKQNPIKAIANSQNHRFLWAFMAVVCIGLVVVSHSFLQGFAYMPPCEQCVYIRYAFLVIALGGIIACFNPSNVVLKILAYILAMYGAIRGIMFSVKLNAIHHAIHSDDLFGVQGCSLTPSFDFNLPLHIWFPSLFNPIGDCGLDNSSAPFGVELEGFRKMIVELYSDGWYLIPSEHFINMAQCCLFAFSVCLLLLIVMLVSWIISYFKIIKS